MGNPIIQAAGIYPVRRCDGHEITEISDELAQEEPLEIRARGHAISITMRTPGHDAELAAGFLLSEGIIHGSKDVLRIEPCDQNEEGNILNVILSPEIHLDLQRLTRHVFASSSCGICGKATIESVRGHFPPIDSDMKMESDLIFTLADKMRKSQATFDRTGGLHAAALFDQHGNLLVVREDVGRHNAVDKVLGFAILNNHWPLDRHLLLVSGRSSFEIMQKALAGRVPIVAAISAPSSLAVEFAIDSGQTLIGFLRDQRMNLYANPWRIHFANQTSSAK